jgi:hypothetical protein
MANRLCDTAIQDKPWYRKLSPEMKSVWRFLTDKCDHAGVWEIDQAAFKFYIEENSTLTIDQIMSVPAFKERFVLLADKIFIPGFVLYQYKISSLDKLNPQNKVHKSVIDRLQKVGVDLFKVVSLKPLGENFKPHLELLEGAKDKEQDKDKVQEKEPSAFKIEFVESELKRIFTDFYPINVGLELGVAELLPLIHLETAESEISDLERAVKAYAKVTKPEFAKNINNFVKNWREYLPKTIKSEKSEVQKRQEAERLELEKIEPTFDPSQLPDDLKLKFEALTKKTISSGNAKTPRT